MAKYLDIGPAKVQVIVDMPQVVPGNPLSPNVEAVTNSSVDMKVVEQTPFIAEAKAAADAERSALYDYREKEDSFGEVSGALLGSVPTAALIQWSNKIFEYDKTLQYEDSTLDRLAAAKQVIAEYNLEETPELYKKLNTVGSLAGMQSVAASHQKYEQDMQILSRHGAAALAAQVVDPLSIVTGIATGGVTKAYQMGRLASAGTYSAGFTGLTAAEDAMSDNKDYTPLDYALTAAISGAFGSMLAPVKQPMFKQGAWQALPGAIAFNRFFSETDNFARTPRLQEIGSRIVSDPVRREGYFNPNNAADIHRRLENVSDGHRMGIEKQFNEILKTDYGIGGVARVMNLKNTAQEASTKVWDDIYLELDRRFYFPERPSTVSNAVKKYADLHDEATATVAMNAKRAVVGGFEDLQPRAGYAHRAPLMDGIYSAIHRATAGSTSRDGKAVVTNLISASIRSAAGGSLQADEAKAIAQGWLNRMIAKDRNQSSDIGDLMQRDVDTESFVTLINASDATDIQKASMLARITAAEKKRGTVGYSQYRIPMDMAMKHKLPDGTEIRMIDFVDTNLNRVTGDYITRMNGRSALSMAGVGRDSAQLTAVRNEVANEASTLTKAQRDEVMWQYDTLMSDFLGNVPQKNVLGANTHRFAMLARNTQLMSMGVLQSAETATIAAKYGIGKTMAAMGREIPGLKQAISKLTPSLAEELEDALSINLSRDIRSKAFTGQQDSFITGESAWIDRALHASTNALPIITGMKVVHGMQTQATTNLAIQAIAKAMKGDAASLAMVKSYSKGMDWDGITQRNLQHAVYNGNVVKNMNWNRWSPTDQDAAVDTLLRMVDDAVMAGRTGQSAPILRTATGKVLGMYRGFVSLAHNKLLRGTLHNEGALGVALLAAHQYPASVIAVMANDARKGQLGDFVDDEKYREEVMWKAVRYVAVLGFNSDILTLGTDQAGLRVPLLGVTAAPGMITTTAYKQYHGLISDDTAQDNYTRAAGAIFPLVNTVLPGINKYQQTLED